MNTRNLLVSIILIAFQCRNNALLLGVQQKAVFNKNLTSRSFAVGDTLISRTRPTLPPGRCHVSLTVNPSPAILGSLVTFYSMLNCSVIPPIEYQCCYYFWQDNFSENTSMTVGLMTSFLSKIYEPRSIMRNKYIMEVMVCWKKILVKSQRKDLKNSVCNYSVALNTTVFELTVTLNGFLKFKQDRDYRGSPSVLMVGKESVAMFVPTDQRLEMLTYKWRVNASIYMESRNSSIHFIPANVGMISVEVHVFDNVSHNIGHFKHSIQCKDPILDAFIKGDKQLLVESNGTFIVTYVGSAPFSFCWRVEPSDYSEDWTCMYNLSNTVGNVMGSAVFSVQANRQSGQQKIIANLTNDVSKKVLTFQFRVFPTGEFFI
ncbi:unnamed protein product [Acanthosepion pharaonis]|uniref:Uncharacterized protein n=1 Tax=Acanthosepion pharaonis TaxID=158019 RepID=A0A812C8Q7_ACAPH|nr:unnamed protein product [Sepia pharaonis]